jgi:hypothetical protein
MTEIKKEVFTQLICEKLPMPRRVFYRIVLSGTDTDNISATNIKRNIANGARKLMCKLKYAFPEKQIGSCLYQGCNYKYFNLHAGYEET